MEEFNDAGWGFFWDEADDVQIEPTPYNYKHNYEPDVEDDKSEDENFQEEIASFIPPVTDAVKKVLKKQIHVPLTCFMFSKSYSLQDDTFYYPGLFYKEIELLGRAKDVQFGGDKMTFTLYDNTGCTEVVIQFKECDVPVWAKQIVDNVYYKVYGTAKAFRDKKSILAARVSRVTDFNEITNHFLNVFLNESIRTQGVLSPLEIKDGKRHTSNQNNDASRDTNERSYDKSEDVEIIQKEPTPKPKKESSKQNPGELKMADIKWKIMSSMRELSLSSDWVSGTKLFKSLKDKITQKQFDTAIEMLIDDVQIFSNDDNSTFSLV